MQLVFALVWKDLLIDLRRKENFISMFLFSVLTLTLFQFAMGDQPRQFLVVLPGIIWVVFLMTGVLGLSKAFQQEVETGCIRALLLSPVDRTLLFLGKMLATTLFLLLSQLFFIPLCLLFFNLVLERWGVFMLLSFAGTLGFSALGTLLTAMTATLRGKEVLLPVLLFPLMIPCLLSVVKITAFLLFDSNAEEVNSWWQLLIGFDAILCVVSMLGFEFVMEE